MNGNSVAVRIRQRLLVAVVLLLSIRHLDATSPDGPSGCNRSSDKCVIKAVFQSIRDNVTVDVVVSCLRGDEIAPDRYSNADKIEWNGCETPTNTKGLGLRKISWRSRVKQLRIEKFSVESLEAGTFDGFSELEVLTFENNSIRNLLPSCFRGLQSLKVLQMMENNLKWLGAGVLGDMPTVKSIEIHDKQHLLIASHQFRGNQTLDNVKLEIYYMEMDPLEHLLLHVRNLSIAVNFNVTASECHQVRLNGYEKQWIVERLSLANFSCGFVMENVDSVATLELIRAIQLPHSEFKLQNLRKLEEIALHDNNLDELSLRVGNFERLTTFDVSRNRMKSIDMRMFAASQNLKTINLKGNFLTKLDWINAENFLLPREVKLLVDGNNFECSWLFDISTTEVFTNFVFQTNFTGTNVDGLGCALNRSTLGSAAVEGEGNNTRCIDLRDDNARGELLELKNSNFILGPGILAAIVCAASLLGMALSFISIRVYHKRQLLKQTPFYHLLRGSLLQPISGARITLGRDFKEIVSRRLPATHYEHPISTMTDATEMSDLTCNIYEEIPNRESLTGVFQAI